MKITNNDLEHMSILLKTMSDPTRLKILTLLFDEDYCVCCISEKLEMTHSSISHQLAILKKQRLVKSVRQGKHIIYSLDDGHINDIVNIALNHVRE